MLPSRFESCAVSAKFYALAERVSIEAETRLRVIGGPSRWKIILISEFPRCGSCVFSVNFGEFHNVVPCAWPYFAFSHSRVGKRTFSIRDIRCALRASPGTFVYGLIGAFATEHRRAAKIPGNDPPDLPETRYLDNRIFTDDGIFADEMRRIFATTWLFIRHQGEIADAGDFRTTSAGGKPIVVVRGGVYAAGGHEDELVREHGRWRYASHRRVLDTRMLETGTHLPL